MSETRQYRCHVPKIDVVAFYDAKNAAAAKYRCWKAAREAGYKIAFGDVRVRLALVSEEVMERQDGRAEATADMGRLS